MIAPPVGSLVARSGSESIYVNGLAIERATPGLTMVATAQPGGRSCTAPATGRGEFACVIEGLTNDTAYTVSAYITSAAGNSDTFTAADPVIPLAPAGPPDAPRDITVTVDELGVATIRWQAVPSDPRAPVVSYVPRLVDNFGQPIFCEAVSGDTTSRRCSTRALTPGRSYVAAVYAQNRVGAGAEGFSARSVTYLTPPGVVKSLTAQPGPGQVSLLWEAPDDGGGAPVKSYTVTADGRVVCRLDAPATGCLVRDLENERTYTFAVTASNGSRTSESATVSAKPRAGLPSAPRNVGARLDGQGGVKVVWEPPATSGGGDITGYEVVLSRDGVPDVNDVACRVGGAVFECVVPLTAASQGQQWTFGVRAVTDTGTGPYSPPSLPVTVVLPPTATVRGLGLVPGYRSVSVSWGDIQQLGGRITGGLVRLQPGGATCQVPTGVQGCTIQGLTNGVEYTAYMAVLNEAGYGPWAESQPATPRATLPGAPTGVQALPGANGDVQVSWAPPEFLGDSPITGYIAVARLGPVTSDAGSCRTDGDLSCVIEGLPLEQNGVPYSYVVLVHAVTADGGGPFSEPTAPFEPGAVGASAPAPVTDLRGVAEDGCVSVSWLPSASNGGAPIGSQSIDVVGNSVSVVGLPMDVNASQYRMCGLTNGESYSVQVFVANRVGRSASEVISVTPRAAPMPPQPPAVPPQAPGAPVGVAGRNVVELTWAAAPTADVDQVTGYHVQRRVAGTEAWADVTANTGTALTRLTVGSLANGRGYEFRVRAVNADGAGPWSDASIAVTPRSDRPGAPGRPVGTAGNGQVDLQWAAPQDDGGGEIVGYQVEVSTDGQNWVVAIPDTRSSLAAVTVPGLTNGTSYVFRVAAINDAGVGDASDVSDASIASEPSAPVQPLPPVAPPPPGPPLPPPPPPAPTPVVGPGPAPGPPPTVVPDEPEPGRVASSPVSPTATALVESARVSWSKPTSTGTGAITHYWVQATPGGLGCESTPEEPLSCVVTGLTPGTSYTFTVEAINPVGFSLPSEPSNAVVPRAAKKSIVIKGKRPKATRVVVRGTTTGLAAGTTLTPRYRVLVNGKGKWKRGKAITLKVTGKFTFRLKVKASQTIQVRIKGPAKVKSNSVTVAPKR